MKTAVAIHHERGCSVCVAVRMVACRTNGVPYTTDGKEEHLITNFWTTPLEMTFAWVLQESRLSVLRDAATSSAERPRSLTGRWTNGLKVRVHEVVRSCPA